MRNVDGVVVFGISAALGVLLMKRDGTHMVNIVGLLGIMTDG